MLDVSSYYNLLLLILIGEFLLTTLLNFLNSRHFDDPVPLGLEDVYDHKDYRKSQLYKKANYRLGLFTSTFSLLFIVGLLAFDGFGYIDKLANTLSTGPLQRALVFFGIILLGSDLFNTPFSYYQTFVIEEKFGFNKTTITTFWLDKLKSWAMILVLGGILLSLIFFFYEKTGDTFWWYAWLLMALFIVFFNLFYSKLIVPLFNKQTPLEQGELKANIEGYAKNVGFELQDIVVINGSKRTTKANAYFSGFGKEKRITLYDTLINNLKVDELTAVLAHEVGHYKKKHIIYNLILSLVLTGFMLFLLSLFINNPHLSKAIGVQNHSFHAALIGFGILYSPISLLTGLLNNYISRKFEFEADEYAKRTHSSKHLVMALKNYPKTV